MPEFCTKHIPSYMDAMDQLSHPKKLRIVVPFVADHDPALFKNLIAPMADNKHGPSEEAVKSR